MQKPGIRNRLRPGRALRIGGAGREELAAGEKLAASAAAARTQLEQNPDDPKANETVGKYLCLYVSDWPTVNFRLTAFKCQPRVDT